MAGDAIPAATLILVREEEDGPPELLMVVRSESLAFAPGALVFPGGRIDPEDVTLARELGHEDGGARIAAVRETIEECGVAVGLEPLPSPEQTAAMQQALVGGADFAGLVGDLGLSISADALTPFARWVPGHEVSRRFDTLFFVARSSGAPVPRVGSAECVSARWVSAAAALQEEEEESAKLIYPTRKNLERIAQSDSFEAMVRDAAQHAVAPITAEVVEIGGADFVVIPEGLGYPVTRDPLASVWRG